MLIFIYVRGWQGIVCANAMNSTVDKPLPPDVPATHQLHSAISGMMGAGASYWPVKMNMQID